MNATRKNFSHTIPANGWEIFGYEDSEAGKAVIMSCYTPLGVTRMPNIMQMMGGMAGQYRVTLQQTEFATVEEAIRYVEEISAKYPAPALI